MEWWSSANGAREALGRAFGRASADGAFMQSGLYVSLSGQVALERRLDAIANNVANMNTAGYRADGVTFSAELVKAGDQQVAFASPGTTFISRAPGALSKTGNPLDLAIEGDGWFAIQTPNGIAYTRDGRMQLTETGALQTVNGFQVLDAGGAPIGLDANGSAPTISADGMITQDGKQVSAIGLFSIPKDANLIRTVNSGVIPDKPPTPILDFTQNGVAQGSIEGSNVNPIMEMTKLIEVTRTFDSISAAMTQSESSLQDAIKTLGGAA
jgi:flagellar basal-body rod protein FlgF